MFNAYEIVKSVFEKYRGLPERLAGITAKTADLFRSHGYQPKTENPMACGNPSPVTHYMTYCRQYEGGMSGSGRTLNNLVHEALDSEFAENDIGSITQQEINVSVLSESCDVEKMLASIKLDEASNPQLRLFEGECDDAINAFMLAKARARVIRKQRELRKVG
jgi:hypothetical protein